MDAGRARAALAARLSSVRTARDSVPAPPAPPGGARALDPGVAPLLGFLHGPSGTGKSTHAGVAQCFFGDFGVTRAAVSFGSTPLSIELEGHLFRGAVMVVGDVKVGAIAEGGASKVLGLIQRAGDRAERRRLDNTGRATDDLVLDVVREAARDPALLAEAVEEANRMAREQVDPLRRRVEQLRAELAEAEDSATRTFQQILSAGISASGMAKKLLGEAEERQRQLQAALAQAEGELDTRKGEHLDLEVIVDAIRGFDLAFEHLELAEKREFIQLMCRQVVVHPDRVEIELYEGRSATRWLTKNPKVQAAAKTGDVPGGGGGVPGAVPGAGNAGGQND